MHSCPRHRRSSRLPLAFAILIAPFAFAVPRNAGAVSITPEQAGVKNFGQVNENYFRGAQPNQAAFQRLGSLGIRAVIDLQEEGVPGESTWVRTAGMQYYCVPLSGNRPATDAQTARFLELVNDPANWPVYVHCHAGRHRTGEMTGIYRITHDTWTADRAFEEMRRYGYYSFPFHGSLKDYVYKYYDAHRAAVAANSTVPLDSARVASTSLSATNP